MKFKLKTQMKTYKSPCNIFMTNIISIILIWVAVVVFTGGQVIVNKYN